ncbi:MAG: hypothetical protein SVU32_05450 [Candidatus Nanohaloarchaea archaeon]|nr:hypothetical protein [Candidatus Nanohaloarchaea archaeon]
MATRCPRCGNWIKEGEDACSDCGYEPDSQRSYSNSRVEGNPL